MFKTALLLASTVFMCSQAKAQYGDAYHAPNQEAIRQATVKRQQAQSDQHFENIKPGAKPSTTTAPAATTTSSYNPYAAEHQAKMAAYDAKQKAITDAWEAKESRFRELSADVPKNEANYNRLVELAEQAGFDYYDATRLNGRYKPKIIELPQLMPFWKQKYDAFISKADDCKINKWPEVEVNYLQHALTLLDDPAIRFRAAGIYFNDLKNYDSAAAQYDYIQRNPVTNKPSISTVYYNWGKAALMANDFATAIHVLGVYREFHKDEDASFYLSYAYFSDKNYDAAFGQLLDGSTYTSMTNQNNLLQNFYLIQNGSAAEAAELFEKNKLANADVTLSGNMTKDLSMMLYKFAKEIGKENISITTLYMLDVAVALDPNNMDFIETRYGYNTKMKRTKQTLADEALLSK